MERMNRMVVRKMTADSQEYKNDDAGFVDGTPQERWQRFWELFAAASYFVDLTKPIQRNVVRKIHAN